MDLADQKEFTQLLIIKYNESLDEYNKLQTEVVTNELNYEYEHDRNVSRVTTQIMQYGKLLRKEMILLEKQLKGEYYNDSRF